MGQKDNNIGYDDRRRKTDAVSYTHLTLPTNSLV